MSKDVIIACDFSSGEETLSFLEKFRDMRPPYVKVGMELFYSEGSEIVKKLKDRGHPIFLDLKLHDIPNTVKKAMSAIKELGVDMINVHAMGGSRMMQEARNGLMGDSDHTGSKRDNSTRPLLIAVTMLTSLSQEMLSQELLISDPINDVISSYALNAKSCGLDGVVCSPLEANLIHKTCGEDFITVTPGIRFEDPAGNRKDTFHPTSASGGIEADLARCVKDDQMRITTPKMARELGSDYIVVGRPITRASDPEAAYNYCLEQFVGNTK